MLSPSTEVDEAELCIVGPVSNVHGALNLDMGRREPDYPPVINQEMGVTVMVHFANISTEHDKENEELLF